MNSGIIVGDYIYLVCIGNLKVIDKIIKKMNAETKGTTYIKHNLGTPCIDMIDDNIIQQMLQQKNEDVKKHIVFDDGIEKAHCYIYADADDNQKASKNLWMLMTITENKTNIKISYPILQVDDEENSEKIINKWLTTNKLNEFIDTIAVRWISIVGKSNDILVFAGYINSD